MNNAQIAKLHNKVFSTPQGSKEREQAYSALSEAEQAAVYDYDMGVRSGRIKEIKVSEQEGNGNMTYQQYKNKMKSDKRGTMQELSKFAKEYPELYKQYRERYHKEQDEQQRIHNRQLNGI